MTDSPKEHHYESGVRSRGVAQFRCARRGSPRPVHRIKLEQLGRPRQHLLAACAPPRPAAELKVRMRAQREELGNAPGLSAQKALQLLQAKKRPCLLADRLESPR